MALRPNDPNPWDTRGDILYQSNHDDKAIEAYRKVIGLKLDFSAYSDYVKLAIVYADQKKFAIIRIGTFGKAIRGSSKDQPCRQLPPV